MPVAAPREMTPERPRDPVAEVVRAVGRLSAADRERLKRELVLADDSPRAEVQS
jgi:hypothetical protein